MGRRRHHGDTPSMSHGTACRRWSVPVATGLVWLISIVVTAVTEFSSMAPAVSGGFLSYEIFTPASHDGKSLASETQAGENGEVSPMTAETSDGEAIPTGREGTGTTNARIFRLSSVQAINDYRAHDGGAMAEWQPGYYVAHDWSSAGRSILAMQPGDVVYVDGRSLVVAGVTKFREDEYVENIRAVLGYDCVIFQTCYPGSYNRIVYGYGKSFGNFTIV